MELFKQKDNVIIVGALNSQKRMAYFSNYGDIAVDVYCPGTSINSVVYGGEVINLSGTSMAAPFAANHIGKMLDKGITTKKELISHLIAYRGCKRF